MLDHVFITLGMHGMSVSVWLEKMGTTCVREIKGINIGLELTCCGQSQIGGGCGGLFT